MLHSLISRKFSSSSTVEADFDDSDYDFDDFSLEEFDIRSGIGAKLEKGDQK